MTFRKKTVEDFEIQIKDEKKYEMDLHDTTNHYSDNSCYSFGSSVCQSVAAQND